MSKIIANANARFQSNKRSTMSVTEKIADSLMEIRSGVAYGCFEMFVRETGPITAVPYAQFYNDGSHAPTAYQTYLVNSPVSAPISNCASETVFEITYGSRTIYVCDSMHVAMTYCYIGTDIGCSQPEVCPVEA